jgi:hypothetical protein
MWAKIERHWIATYELLHVAAYRLLGKRYVYQGGVVTAQPSEALTPGQQLFCLLFPLLATLVTMLALAALWLYTYIQFFPHIAPRTYYFTAPPWHIALQLLLLALPLLASPAYFDLRRAIRLLTEPTHQPPEQTPNQERKREHPQ